MTSNRHSGAGDEPSTTAESEALAEAQRWLESHGVAPPEPVPIRAESAGPAAHAGDRAQRSERSGSDRTTSRRRRGQAEPPEPVEDPESVARAVVFRKLAAQARTRHELDRALQAKDVPEPVAAQVLDRMEEVGLVDDAVFARDWVESRQRRRQLSRRALRHELEAKGVDRDDIDEALQSVDTDDEYAAARMLVQRKVRSMHGLAPDVRYRRLVAALARRGFSGGLTARVIGEVLAEERA